MPRLRLTIGNGEQMEPGVLEATPLGLLGAEALVRVGPVEIRGSAKAMRRLATAAHEAADLAESHDREREGS